MAEHTLGLVRVSPMIWELRRLIHALVLAVISGKNVIITTSILIANSTA
jgi:hypothetical protein